MSHFKADPRDAMADVTCELRSADTCAGTHAVSLRAQSKNRGRNGGVYMCFWCSRRTKYSGRKNPNARHALDDRLLETIDSEAKAYLLGWIGSDGSVSKGTVSISIHERDAQVLRDVVVSIGSNVPVVIGGGYAVLRLCSQQIVADVCRWFGIVPGKKSYTINFPDVPEEHKWAFVRGYFDGDGHVRTRSATRSVPMCGISSSSPNMRRALRELTFPPAYESGINVSWEYDHALAFLARVYEGATISLRRKREKWEDWQDWTKSLAGPRRRIGGATWTRTMADAVAPVPHGDGFIMSGVRVVHRSEMATVVDTGIKVYPDDGRAYVPYSPQSLTDAGMSLLSSHITWASNAASLVFAVLHRPGEELKLPLQVAWVRPQRFVDFELQEVA